MAKTDRKGKRKKRESAPRRVPNLGYYIVVTDTKATEGYYLYGLRDSLPKDLQGKIVIRVSTAKTDELVERCKSLAALEPQYGEPWIVFDRDRVTNFDEIIQKAHRAGIKTGWSNPCIEIWFDAYFGQMHGYQDSKQCVRRFSETFERITGSEYSKSDRKLYETLTRYGNESKAIEIAEKRLKNHKDSGMIKPSEMIPATMLCYLVDEIKSKTD